MKARNRLEQMALDMVKNGEPIHGFLRDVLIDMSLREMEEQKNEQANGER